jgi:hypothetical protein
MFILEISLEYDAKRTATQYEKMCEAQGRQLPFKRITEDGMYEFDWSNRDYVITDEELVHFVPCVVNRIRSVNTYSAVKSSDIPQLNTQIHVATPGDTLAKYDQVQVMTDCCTESLQEELSNGWRILAICPQPDQRRPDYILGKATVHASSED